MGQERRKESQLAIDIEQVRDKLEEVREKTIKTITRVRGATKYPPDYDQKCSHLLSSCLLCQALVPVTVLGVRVLLLRFTRFEVGPPRPSTVTTASIFASVFAATAAAAAAAVIAITVVRPCFSEHEPLTVVHRFCQDDLTTR